MLNPSFHLKESDKAYALEAASTGIDKRPVPIIPKAKIDFEISPEFGNDLTSGSRDFAACSAV